MSRMILKGATSQTVYVEILDSTSTTGGRKTGLAYNTASLTAYYVRNGGSATAITLATLAAANSAWSSGGFKEVDATNMPGVYRLDVPDAALAAGSGDSVVITLKGATGMAQVSTEIQLTSVNLQDAVRGGMTALPNAAAEAAGGLYTRGTGAGQINQPANGMIDGNVVRNAGTAITAAAGIQEVKVASMAANVMTAAAAAADLTTELQSGLATASALSTTDGKVDAIKAKTDLIPGTIDGKTFAQIVTLISAVLLGKASGMGSTTGVFRDMADTKDRVTATIDADGNRSAVTLDAS